MRRGKALLHMLLFIGSTTLVGHGKEISLTCSHVRRGIELNWCVRDDTTWTAHQREHFFQKHVLGFFE